MLKKNMYSILQINYSIFTAKGGVLVTLSFL